MFLIRIIEEDENEVNDEVNEVQNPVQQNNEAAQIVQDPVEIAVSRNRRPIKIPRPIFQPELRKIRAKRSFCIESQIVRRFVGTQMGRSFIFNVKLCGLS